MFSQMRGSGRCISVSSLGQVVRLLRMSHQSPAFPSGDLRVSPVREQETTQPSWWGAMEHGQAGTGDRHRQLQHLSLPS